MALRAAVDAGYVLHSRRFRENGLLVEILTRDHGRLGLVARHALGNRRGRRGETLQPFRPLSVEWRGRGELPNLVRHEPAGRARVLAGERLFSGLYVNELTLRFTERADPAPALYAAYAAVLDGLESAPSCELVLRRFELALLEACGYGLALETCADEGTPVRPETTYHYQVEHGALARRPPGPCLAVPGTALLALAGRREFDVEAAAAAKRLMRFVISHHLGGRPLAARSLFTREEDRETP